MDNNSHQRIILLVDDKPANIQVAHNILKDAYTIKIATSGVKALDLAKTLPQPDLILLDIVMPEMDGYEVCTRLKTDPGTRDIPIIFLTGKTDAEDETKGFELGAIDYIHKPFSPLVVQARIRTQLTLLEAREQLDKEKGKVDRLLDNILPPQVVAEIKVTGGVIPRRFENVAVLFSDLVGFTNYCDRHPPEEVVRELEGLFVTFESCMRAHGLEKIKTMGDAFLATAGLLEPTDDALHSAVRCALAISGVKACHDGDMKAHPEYTEGPEAWTRFAAAMKRVIAVPREEIQRKIEQHRKEADMNPRKRGPKRKPKPSA